jgi:hypothetical protein
LDEADNEGKKRLRTCDGRDDAAAASKIMMVPGADEMLIAAIAGIDAANACDPNTVEIDGHHEPAELVYGRRMSDALSRMAPEASTHLTLAARGQHIERWTSPRKSYPEGRAGYLRWREDLKAFHAKRLAEIMQAAGYGTDDIARVGALVRKERLKRDPEAQTLEDVACIVFLEFYVETFMSKTDDEKLAGIVAKTWGKMSSLGHEHARRLALPPRLLTLLEQGLAHQRKSARA